MLNQETSAEQTHTTSQPTPISPPSPISVVQARVTPDELASALAAIEARRQAEATRLAGTIPLEEAVSSLHLDATPDEIWAEVQAQRASSVAAQNPFVHPSFAAADAARREQLRLAQPTPQVRQAPQAVKPRSRSSRGWPFGLIGPIFAVAMLLQTGIIHLPSFSSHSTSPAAHVAESTTLDKIHDSQEVYTDTASLVQLSQGKPLTQIKVDTTEDDNRWTILKLGGHVYLHGYIAHAASPQSLQGQAIDVYNDADSGDLHGVTTSNIRLRVDAIPLSRTGGDDDYSEVTVPNFHLDTYTTVNEGR